tara:strand:- start:176 stop:439 length:264 start_codon:yes stop_codon:yes gene_type:complete
MTKKEREKLDKEVRKVIFYILSNISYLFDYTSKKTLGEAIEACRNDKDAREGILKTYGLRFEMIEVLYKTNIITDDMAGLIHENRAK